MSDFDVSKLQKWIGKAKQIGEPPGPKEGRGTKSETVVARHEQVVQLNLRVSASTKKRMKHLAARDDINLATLLTRMVDLYEKQHGALPDMGEAPLNSYSANSSVLQNAIHYSLDDEPSSKPGVPMRSQPELVGLRNRWRFT